jgi:transcriptional regulator with XRE-family HTH domain
MDIGAAGWSYRPVYSSFTMSPLSSPRNTNPRSGSALRESIRGWNPAKLRAARQQAELTQAEVAGLTGCDPSLIARWESDRGGPSTKHIRALVEALEVEVADLVDVRRDELLLGDLRAWAGGTQTQVKKDLRLHRISDIEAGALPLPQRVRVEMAALYGVDVDELAAAADRTRKVWRRRLDERRRSRRP